MTPRVHRQIRLTGLANGAELTMRTLYGEDHLVVPVVALVGDAVVRPLNSKGAEFVPSEELRKSTHQWANRPVVPDHPDNGRASANDPAILEAMAFGSTFNPRFEDGRLKLEAWLNLKRAAALGGDPQRVVDRARAGEMIEVSVGAWVAVLETAGVSPTGTAYQYRWSDIDSDHLAMLPEGAEGACSVDMGCGAPRAARAKENGTMSETTKRTLRERLRSLFGGEALDFLRFRGAADGMSDGELRGKLDRELFATEPGYLGIDAVYPDENLVVYAVAPDEEVVLYERAYSMGEDGEVGLAEERREVEFVGRYEPVTAEAQPAETKEPAAAGDCGCPKEGRSIRAAQTSTAAEAEGERMTKKELVERLIAAERSPFDESDREHLASKSDVQLATLDAQFGPDAKAEKPEDEAEPQKAAPPTEPEPQKVAAPNPHAEEIAQLRQEIDKLRPSALAFEAAQKSRKDALVARLKGAQTTYTEARLQAKGVDELQEIASLLKLDEPRPDYSGQGMPITSASAGNDLAAFQAPDTYGLQAAKTKAAPTKETN